MAIVGGFTFGAREVTLSPPHTAQDVSMSPHDFSTQVVAGLRARWTGRVTLTKKGPIAARLVDTFAAELDGSVNTFYLGDPHRCTSAGTARDEGTISGVIGARTVTVTQSFNGTLVRGDHVSCNGHLYIVMADWSPAATTLSILPGLRDTGGATLTKNPHGLWRLAPGESIDATRHPGGHTTYSSFNIIEAFER